MQGFRGDAILCAGHVPRRGEPNHERSTCAVEDGSGRHRDAALALFAPESPATHPPTAGRVASRTDETVGPAKPFKIVETGRFVREPRQQIGIAGRIISPCSKIGGRRLRRKRHPYILCLQHSDGHPFRPMTATLVLGRIRCSFERGQGSASGVSEKGFAAVGNKCLIYRGQHGGIWLTAKVNILGRTIDRKMSTKTRTADMF